MLRLKNIKKDYVAGDAVVSALKGVSLEFRANEFVSVLGQSGCGKTTLLNIIGGLDRYTSGDLIVRGKSTKDYTDRDWDVYRNHRIGFVFQSYNLIPHQTVLGNVELALTIAGCSKAERRRRARAALERVGLGKELHKKPNQLSGGQMQRVAIARALVNNPEILLADEPTGALDSETSVQIMDLIREIAGERLVIMVTHNPELAEKYSSRIIRLKDGVVVSDSAPYDASKEREVLARKLEKSGWTAKSALAWKREKEKKERKRTEKASMSFFTALGLSARNLRAKKGRTIVTSIAGSIGIISVCLVLALSNGFNRYIVKTEEDMLSYYPLRVTETSINIDSVMSNMTSRADMPDLSELDDKVYVNSFLTKLAKGMTVTNKISAEYLSYIEAMDESYYYAIQYGYGLDLSSNLFTNVNTGDTKENMQTQTMSLSSLKEYYTRELETNAGEQYGQMAYLVDYLGSVCGVMPGTDDVSSARYGEYVKSQYDVFGSFPSSSDEAVLVIGGNNDANDLLLAQLGFIDEPDFLSLFSKDAGADEYMTIDFDSVLEKRFTLFYNDAVYTRNQGSFNVYPFSYNGTRDSLSASSEEGVNIKISGILRLKDGLSYGCLSSGLNLTEQLINEYIAENKTSQIVTLMESDLTSSEVNYGGMKLTVYRSPSANLNEYYTRNEEASSYFGTDIYIAVNQKNAVRALGGCSDPNSVSFYPKDFDSKDKMLSYLDEWNASHEDDEKITYTDTVGLMMGMMQTMLNAITYVLVAFTAISLVVSSVMIGIITYVSVVERTKEIGVLRSLGSRKKDVRNLFNAETFIIGLSSGVFGTGVTYALSVAINVVMKSLTGIANLAALPLTSALIMVCVSVVLTLISGLIPARAAARKDPVIALRTE